MKRIIVTLSIALAFASCKFLNQAVQPSGEGVGSNCLLNPDFQTNEANVRDMSPTNCLPWKFFGTPSIGDNKGFAIWSNNGVGESVFQDYSFKKGKRYLVSFKYSSYWNSAGPNAEDQKAKFYLRAINGFSSKDQAPINTGSFYLPTTEGAYDDIFSDGFQVASNPFKTVSLVYVPKANYSKLWILPEKKNLGVQANLSFTCLSVCEAP